MMEFLQIAGHIVITVIAVAALALRIEHRLTKIETDISWLKTNQKCEKKGERENGNAGEVD